MNLNVVQCHILDSHQIVRGAADQWEQHATRTYVAVRLVLLLGTNVDSPPEWFVNLNVVVENVGDFSTGAWEHGLGLTHFIFDIDALDWVVHLAVEELDVSHAVEVI